MDPPRRASPSERVERESSPRPSEPEGAGPMESDRPDSHAWPNRSSGTDPATIRRVRWISHVLDDAVRIPGTDRRIGLDPVLGVVPGLGDAVATAFSLYVVVEAARAGVPARTLVKMLAFVAVDSVVGSVPVVGPVFDAFWKANRWNVNLLEAHLEAQVPA